MRHSSDRKPRPPLDAAKLDELALSYVGRFATTRAKLRTYLTRKLRERGWDGAVDPDLERLAERFAAQGYIDDAAFALSKSRSLTGRGYGLRRVELSLRAAGVEDGDAGSARDLANAHSVESALRFAERRRIGPFAALPVDRHARERAIAVMIRAGHDFRLARKILEIQPGEPIDRAALAQDQSYTDSLGNPDNL